jgi:transposase-like protein
MKAKTKISQIYDDSFKRKVVDEFLKGKLTKIELRRKYNIGGKSAILTWMRQLGYADCNRWPKKIKFRVESTHTSMPTGDKDKLELEKENRELKRKLEDEKLRSEAYLRIIEKAEEELKISLKKKFSSK